MLLSIGLAPSLALASSALLFVLVMALGACLVASHGETPTLLILVPP